MPRITTLVRLLNPMVPKIINPHEIAEITVKFGTPIYAAMYPDVKRPTQLDAFKITS
jgi:hypothetical protein